MMKKFRQMLCSAILGLQLLSLCSLGCGAAEQPAEAAAAEPSPVLKLQEFGILLGDPDGNLQAGRQVTRAEFVTMLMRAASPESLDAASEDSANEPAVFEDVPVSHWAEQAINAAYDEGVVDGCGDMLFMPEAPVKHEEALKMILHVMGYDRQARRKGGYPWGYAVLATEMGIAGAESGAVGEFLSREAVAMLLYQALYTPTASGVVLAGQFEKLPVEQTYYYVSPLGRDDNPGTEEKPWKTLYKAAFTVKAGSTVILEDGVYYEDRSTIVRNSGTEDAPIIFKARNPLQAKIVYPESSRLEGKFNIGQGVNYITLQGVEMTQLATATEEDLNKTADILYNCSGNHCAVIGNKFHHAYEEGVKFYLSTGVLIEDNIITDFVHEAIDLVNCADVIIRNNDMSEFGRIGVFGKGGTRNMLVYNNYVHNKDRVASTGISVGGSTDAPFCYDVAEGTGYEAYNQFFYNNIVHAEAPGAIANALGILAPKDAWIYNNVFIGADQGYIMASGGGISKGWPWWPDVVNVYMRNNIFYNCNTFGQNTVTPTNFVVENNLFYNTDGAPSGDGNISGDPLFVNPESDWHLGAGSPALGSGAAWAESFPAFGGGTLEPEPVDYEGEAYTEPWDIGIYNE